MSANEETKGLLSELKVIVAALDAQKEHIFDSIPDHKLALEEQLKNITTTGVMLQSVPKKLAEQIKSIVPDIAEKLDALSAKKIEEIKSTYQTTLQEQLKSINQTEEKVRFLTENLDKFSRKRLMRFFLGIVISSAISVGCATYAASYMMQTFPTRVTIDKPENIILYDSEVSLWGTDNVKVLKGLKKNDRKNKHKL